MKKKKDENRLPKKKKKKEKRKLPIEKRQNWKNPLRHIKKRQNMEKNIWGCNMKEF